MQSQSLGSHLLILLLKISTVEEFLISIGIMLQTFDAKYVNELKPDFVVLTVCDLGRKNITDYCIGKVFFHLE